MSVVCDINMSGKFFLEVKSRALVTTTTKSGRKRVSLDTMPWAEAQSRGLVPIDMKSGWCVLGAREEVALSNWIEHVCGVDATLEKPFTSALCMYEAVTIARNSDQTIELAIELGARGQGGQGSCYAIYLNSHHHGRCMFAGSAADAVLGIASLVRLHPSYLQLIQRIHNLPGEREHFFYEVLCAMSLARKEQPLCEQNDHNEDAFLIVHNIRGCPVPPMELAWVDATVAQKETHYNTAVPTTFTQFRYADELHLSPLAQAPSAVETVSLEQAAALQCVLTTGDRCHWTDQCATFGRHFYLGYGSTDDRPTATSQVYDTAKEGQAVALLQDLLHVVSDENIELHKNLKGLIMVCMNLTSSNKSVAARLLLTNMAYNNASCNLVKNKPGCMFVFCSQIVHHSSSPRRRFHNFCGALGTDTREELAKQLNKNISTCAGPMDITKKEEEEEEEKEASRSPKRAKSAAVAPAVAPAAEEEPLPEVYSQDPDPLYMDSPPLSPSTSTDSPVYRPTSPIYSNDDDTDDDESVSPTPNAGIYSPPPRSAPSATAVAAAAPMSPFPLSPEY
jgi:hypothetical protein